MCLYHAVSAFLFSVDISNNYIIANSENINRLCNIVKSNTIGDLFKLLDLVHKVGCNLIILNNMQNPIILRDDGHSNCIVLNLIHDGNINKIGHFEAVDISSLIAYDKNTKISNQYIFNTITDLNMDFDKNNINNIFSSSK